MGDQDNLFHPESVNEQVEQLLRTQDAQQDTMPGAATLAALKCIYQEDEALLERAWARIARVEAAISTSGDVTSIVDMDYYRGKSTMHETDFSSETRASTTHPIHSAEHPRQTRRARVRRTFSLLAATLAAAVIVGGMLLVIGASRNRNTATGHHSAKQNTQTTVLSGPAIYEGSVDQLVRADAQTGKVVWRYQFPAQNDPYHMGAFRQILPTGKVVYALVGEAGGPAMAFDAATGRVLWTSHLQNINSMALVQGTLYVGAEDANPQLNTSYAYALDSSTGAQSATQYTLTGNSPQLSVVDNVLYAGTDESVTAIDPVHHQQIWQKSAADFGFDVNFGPVLGFSVARGIVYMAIQDGHSSYCFALNASNGDKKWQTPSITEASTGSGGGAGIGEPLASNGMVYFAVIGKAGAVFAYDEQGHQVWSYPTGGLMVQSTPVLSGNTLYIAEDKIGTGDQTDPGQTTLVALDAAKGTVQWQKPPVSGVLISTVTLLNGIVYLAPSNAPGNADLTYAFSASNGTLLWQTSLGHTPYSLVGAAAN